MSKNVSQGGESTTTNREHQYEESIKDLTQFGCMWAEVWQSADDDLWYVTWCYVQNYERDTNAYNTAPVNDDHEGPFDSEATAMEKAIAMNTELLAQELKSPGYGVHSPESNWY